MQQDLIKKSVRGRVVLVPLPFQGHMTPMMYLATALHSKGFNITVAHTHFNSLVPSGHPPEFDFLTIPDNLSKLEPSSIGLLSFLAKLNSVCESLFRDSLVRYVEKKGEEISCVIYDELMYRSEVAAKKLNLPRIILCTSNAITSLARSALLRLNAQGLIPFKGSESQDEVVPELHPLRFKDLPTSSFGSLDQSLQFIESINNKRTACAIIYNTVTCLESMWLAQLRHECLLPMYPIGPFHRIAPRSEFSASLLKEDRNCIEWLDKQKPRSVIYISLGSIALMQENELAEMAWGLANSKQPFLWVIRPGSIPGSEWTESLPKGLSETLTERGCIVKWAPQKEVLAHSTVGGFWSHCGWNSTLESISEGVPMICRPFSGDQKVNARILNSVWRIGFQLEGELERGEVEKAVKMVIVDKEGVEMRRRALDLKVDIEASVSVSGSSYESLDKLVEFITSF